MPLDTSWYILFLFFSLAFVAYTIYTKYNNNNNNNNINTTTTTTNNNNTATATNNNNNNTTNNNNNNNNNITSRRSGVTTRSQPKGAATAIQLEETQKQFGIWYEVDDIVFILNVGNTAFDNPSRDNRPYIIWRGTVTVAGYSKQDRLMVGWENVSDDISIFQNRIGANKKFQVFKTLEEAKSFIITKNDVNNECELTRDILSYDGPIPVSRNNDGGYTTCKCFLFLFLLYFICLKNILTF